MSISTRHVTVGTTPTVLVDATAEAETVCLHSSTGQCYIGASDVSTTTGYRMDNGDKLTIDNKTNGIWAVTAVGTVNMFVMTVGK